MLRIKKIKIMGMAISTVMAIVFLVACTPNDTGLVITDTSVEMNDSNFSGIETHTITLRANDVITVDTKGNVFDILIVDDSGTPMPFSGNGMSGRNLSGRIVEDGEYTITIEGSGRFRVSWE